MRGCGNEGAWLNCCLKWRARKDREDFARQSLLRHSGARVSISGLPEIDIIIRKSGRPDLRAREPGIQRRSHVGLDSG
jgi:hypothetical protein